MRSPRGSLLLATYEMPEHLALVCAALERQSTKDFEVLICDDGSGQKTRQIIESFQAQAPFEVRHFWQENQGFRKCRILNEALRQARGETMIFLDGDCVPHRHFIRDHLEQQEEDRYLAGRRMELGPELSAKLTPEMVRRGFFDRPGLALIRSVLQGDSEHLQRSIRIPWPGLRSRLGMERVDDMKGCNFSVSKKALEAINGFDEAYEGYGREDTDVEIRLQHLGLKIKSLKGLALQFHVWHPRREFTPKNDTRLEDLKRSGRVRCEQGIYPTLG
jgi:glycosyltransferase involved in cell wall biosynthesis